VEALARVRRGEGIDAIAPVAEVAVAERMPRAPKQVAEDDDSDLWPDDEQVNDEEERVPSAGTADGNRRYRVRSLDSFLDELSRLVRCAEDGDLGRFVEADANGRTKMTLALKQLAFLNREVAQLAQ
jgi:hypothetical protein